jgi:hypothetical protein
MVTSATNIIVRVIAQTKLQNLRFYNVICAVTLTMMVCAGNVQKDETGAWNSVQR